MPCVSCFSFPPPKIHILIGLFIISLFSIIFPSLFGRSFKNNQVVGFFDEVCPAGMGFKEVHGITNTIITDSVARQAVET
jgi:hypothetical protein